MSIHDEVMNIARRVVLEADASGGTLSASLLADTMMAEIDPEHASPQHAAYCARSDCVQRLGRVLRKEWGAPSNPVGEKFTEQLEMKDFVDCLQARYPIPHTNGDDFAVYKPIDDLDDDEVDAIAGRMQRIGDKYHKHADQLRRYHRSKKARLV